MATYHPEWRTCYPYAAIRQKTQMMERYITHQKTRTLSYNGVVLQSRDRVFSSVVRESWERANMRVAASGVTSPGDCDAELTNPISGTIAENMIADDNALIFLDLRSNITVVRNERTQVSFNSSSSAYVRTQQWSPFFPTLGTTWVDWRCMIQTGNAADWLTDSATIRSTSSHGEYSQPIAAGVLGNQFGAIPLGEDIWYLIDWEKDGGSDYYYPEWLRSVGRFRDLDKADKELYLNSHWWGPVSGTSSIVDIQIPLKGEPLGSWAVDKDGNRFYSQQTESAVTYNVIKLKDGAAANPDTVMQGTAQNVFGWAEDVRAKAYYPIKLT